MNIKDKEPIVSIICNTYNQKKYIKDALNGFVNQQTSFSYEILIHDDASTDGTADIIRSYEKKYPSIIKPLYQEKNQYSKGISPTSIQLKRAKGKYIAFCEGDDYWTDKNKLQRQYEILQNNPQIDLCSHAVKEIRSSNNEVVGTVEPSKYETILKPEEVILGGGGYLSTCSLFFRKSIFDQEWEFRKVLNLDYSLQIVGSLRGGVYYLPECMANYRVMSNGSWTESVMRDKIKLINVYNKIIEMLKQLNIDTCYIYSDAINDVLIKTEFDILNLENNFRIMKSGRYKRIYDSLPLIRRIKITILRYCPIIRTIKHLINRNGKV